MGLLNKDTDYAVRALTFIASNDEKLYSVKEISESLNLSYSYLRKLLQILNKHSILKSVKGKGGGFKINKNPYKIYLKDIIKIFQGNIEIKHCFVKSNKCPNAKTCLINSKLTKIDNFVKNELYLINIQSLISS
jgi:Rrf2 family protein